LPAIERNSSLSPLSNQVGLCAYVLFHHLKYSQKEMQKRQKIKFIGDDLLTDKAEAHLVKMTVLPHTLPFKVELHQN
jgi:hypothetical protein